MIKRLRIKFIAVTMAIVTVMMTVIFGLVIHFTAEALESESLQLLRDIAQGPFQLPPEAEQNAPSSPYMMVRLNPLGQIVELRGSYPLLESEQWLLDVLGAALETDDQSGVLREYDLRFFRSSDPFGQQFVFADTARERQTMAALTASCVLIGLAGLIAFGTASYLLSGWMVRPVEAAWQEQRQFVADASHELKTPLTVILTNAELLQSPELDDASRARFSRNILTTSHQMRTLVAHMLELARADNGAVRAAFGPVELSALVEEEVLPWEPVYFEQGLTLESMIQPGLQVTGSDAHLRQVLSVLLDNARKYSSPGGAVRLSLKRQGASALLAVENPGEAIRAEDLTNIFRRFYRLDKARSTQGYGLGLSIAQTIAREHGGRLWAESRDGINTFCFQIPLSR